MQEIQKTGNGKKTAGTEEAAAAILSGMSAAKLSALREVDIRTVDKGTLVEISDVKIDTGLPEQERMLDFLRQIKNPYCYLDHSTVVKISFSGGRRLEDCLKNLILQKQPEL